MTEPTHKPAAVAKAIILSLLLFIGLPVGGLMLVWHDHCETSPLNQLLSPSGQYRLTHNQIICKGSQIKPATELTITRQDSAGRWLADEQLLLYAGTDAPGIVWVEDSNLAIQLTAQAEVVKVKQHWQGVQLRLDLPLLPASEDAATVDQGKSKG